MSARGNEAVPFDLSPEDLEGLSMCQWPGRAQLIQRGDVQFFLDGAHTADSVEYCARWFQESSCASSPVNHPVCRVLVFNSTGDRDTGALLSPLSKLKFDLAIFCPNIVARLVSASSDQANYTVTVDQQMKKCKQNLEEWMQQVKSNNGDDDGVISAVFLPCVVDALECLTDRKDPRILQLLGLDTTHPLVTADRVQVLVTGSLHLVGSVLGVVDPELMSQNEPSHNTNARAPHVKSLSDELRRCCIPGAP